MADTCPHYSLGQQFPTTCWERYEFQLCLLTCAAGFQQTGRNYLISRMSSNVCHIIKKRNVIDISLLQKITLRLLLYLIVCEDLLRVKDHVFKVLGSPILLNIHDMSSMSALICQISPTPKWQIFQCLHSTFYVTILVTYCNIQYPCNILVENTGHSNFDTVKTCKGNFLEIRQFLKIKMAKKCILTSQLLVLYHETHIFPQQLHFLSKLSGTFAASMQ